MLCDTIAFPKNILLQGTLDLAEEVLDGQRQRVDVPVHTGTACDGRLEKRKKERKAGRGFMLNRRSLRPPSRSRD